MEYVINTNVAEKCLDILNSICETIFVILTRTRHIIIETAKEVMIQTNFSVRQKKPELASLEKQKLVSTNFFK